MKKIISLLLTAVMLAAMFSVMTLPVFAASGTCGNSGNVHWEVKGDTLRIYGDGAMDDYTGYKQTPWYKAGVYYDDESITKIVIEDGVTKIGSYAFAYFYYIKDIKIGEDVNTIGEYAFYEVGTEQSDSIKIQFPLSLKRIDSYAFRYANIGGEIKTPIYASYIGDYAFSKTNITSVYVSEPYDNDTFWGEYSFYDCQKLIDVTFDNGVTKVGYGAFYKCYALKNIEVPDTMKKFEYAAFGYDESIDDIYYKGTNFLSNVSCDSYNDYINDADYKHYTLHEKWAPKYVDKKGVTVDCNHRAMYNIVTPDRELTDGVWVVREKIDLGGAALDVAGNVTLVLLDNCGITTTGGIHVHPGSTLTIASEQVENTDTMGYIKVPSAPDTSAAIGGGENEGDYNIVILGGNIYAHGGENGAGIGSGNFDNKKDVTVTVSVYNGKIKACGGSGGAGIGAGDGSENGKITVTINNGDIEARSDNWGAGIGSGKGSNATVTINNGKIKAYGGTNGAGIGGGDSGDATVTVNNGDIEAYGGSLGAGIGSGKCANSVVNIVGGNIKAQGGTNAAGIGSSGSGGGYYSNSTINLYGGNITAIAGENAEDIGKGYNSNATVNDYRDSQIPDAAPINAATVKEVTLAPTKSEANGVTVEATYDGRGGWRLVEQKSWGYVGLALNVSVPKDCAIVSVTYHCMYNTTDGYGYPNVSGYTTPQVGPEYKVSDYTTHQNGADCTVDIPLEDNIKRLEAVGLSGREGSNDNLVKYVTVKYCEPENNTGSTLSEGSLWIVIAVAVLALGGVAALVIVKKKKTAQASEE